MPSRLPKRLQPWWNLCVMAEHQTGVDHILLLAVMDRESAGGLTLKPEGAGAAGTGDSKPRHWSRYVDRNDATRFKHWRPSLQSYEDLMGEKLEEDATVPELCLPIDGLGWGRGLMQLDWAATQNTAFFGEVMPDGTPAWKDPWRNIRDGASWLAGLFRSFDGDEVCAVAAYNAGSERVRKAVMSMSLPASDSKKLAAVDHVTTGRNYVSDVLARRDNFRARLATPNGGPPNE